MDATQDHARTDTTPRKLPRDARRSQLIEATIETIAEVGYSRTTLTEVARRAGLSHGLVNFHFQSKEKLLLETLLMLADEYRQNWVAAIAAAGQGAAEQLHALIAADFKTDICSPTRLAAWCSFWGEAQSRPIYQERCGSNDEDYNNTIELLCTRMIREHGYDGNPARIARVLRVTLEGIWLEMMTLSSPYDIEEAKATVMTSAAAFFPRHFDAEGLIGA